MDAQGETGQDVGGYGEGDEEGLEGEGLIVGAGEKEVGF